MTRLDMPENTAAKDILTASKNAVFYMKAVSDLAEEDWNTKPIITRLVDAITAFEAESQ